MTTTKYRPDYSRCSPAKHPKSNNCNDIITFWDCLFGKDQWKDLYKKRADVWEEMNGQRTQRITYQKDGHGRELRKPIKVTRASSADKSTNSENQTKKQKTVFRNYSLEIEPTNLLRHLWPWKIKDHKVVQNAENKEIKQQERTKNENEIDENKKLLVERRIREEQGLMVEENIDNYGVNGIVTQTSLVRRQQGESIRKMSLARTNENENNFPLPISKSRMKKLPSTTFITAQLTDIAMKIDKLENRIISLSSNKQSHSSNHGRGDKNISLPAMKKSGNKTSKQNRIVTKARKSGVTRAFDIKDNKKAYDKRFVKPDEKSKHNNTSNFRNDTKHLQRYTIRRSESNPSLLRIHATKNSKCYNNDIDACILIHTQKKDVCVHGRYLDIKQNSSWWNQITNIFSSFLDKVLYRINTERKIEGDNHNGTMMASNKEHCENEGSSSDDDDDDSFHSIDINDLGGVSKSCSLINRKSVSYTILNSPMKMIDHDYNKEQENVVEKVLTNTKMNLSLDSETFFKGNTSTIIDENCHRNYEDPIERSSWIQDTIIGREAIESSLENHTTDSYNNILGEIYSTQKYRFSHENNQEYRSANQQPKINYYINKKRESDENEYFEMMQLNTENSGQKGNDVLCHSVEGNEEKYGVECSKKKIETHEKGVSLVTFTKILHSKFKSKDSKSEYEEKLTKTVKSKFIDNLSDLSILKQFTKHESFSFFPFSEKELQTNEENNEIFPPNLEGNHRVYQVYESGKLFR